MIRMIYPGRILIHKLHGVVGEKIVRKWINQIIFLYQIFRFIIRKAMVAHKYFGVRSNKSAQIMIAKIILPEDFMLRSDDLMNFILINIHKIYFPICFPKWAHYRSRYTKFSREIGKKKFSF